VASISLSDASGVWLDSNNLYVATLSHGLVVYDIGDITNIQQIGSVSFPTSFWNEPLDVEVSGKYAYVSHHGGGVKIIDISTPSAPVMVAETPGWLVYTSFIFDKTLYYAENASGRFTIVDITNPPVPIVLSSFSKPASASSGWCYDVCADVSTAYFAASEQLYCVDVRDKKNPRELSRITVGGGTTAEAAQVAKSGTSLYVTGIPGILNIYDVKDPVNIHLAKTISLPTNLLTTALSIEGNRLYIPRIDGTLAVFDITDPMNPVKVADLSTGATIGRFYPSELYICTISDEKVKIFLR
jgi:hypothetical protein